MTMYVAFGKQGYPFWGSHMKSTPNGIYYDWVMRPVAMQRDRWYISKGEAIRFTKIEGQFGEPIYCLEGYRDGAYFHTTNYRRDFSNQFYIFSRGWWLEKHADQVNCFFNRLQEYSGSPIIPMSRGNTRLKERYPIRRIQPV